jgi:hypothetical protein
MRRRIPAHFDLTQVSRSNLPVVPRRFFPSRFDVDQNITASMAYASAIINAGGFTSNDTTGSWATVTADDLVRASA